MSLGDYSISFVNTVRSLTKIAINRFGYDVRRVADPSSVHVANRDADPITFEYMCTVRGHAMLEVETDKVRAFHSLALPLRPESHPFVRAIVAARKAPDDDSARQAIEDVLRSYYESVRPRSASDVLGIPAKELPGFDGYAPNSARHPIDVNAVPWTGRSPAEVRLGRMRTANFEGLQNGVLSSVKDGVTSFGPVSPAKLAMEVSRLHRLLRSVDDAGFQRFNARSPLQVAAFRRGTDYRWIINSGQHRFAIAAAFEIATLPAMITEVIRREDAGYWPQVVAGVFTERGALTLFDRIFDGDPAPICREWIDRDGGADGLANGFAHVVD